MSSWSARKHYKLSNLRKQNTKRKWHLKIPCRATIGLEVKDIQRGFLACYTRMEPREVQKGMVLKSSSMGQGRKTQTWSAKRSERN